MGIKNDVITLRRLLCFAQTAKNGQISATAITHGLKQSNLSNCIKDLEKNLNIKLLNRVYNGVVLTQSGRELLSITNELENIIDKVDDFFKKTHKLEGCVTLAIPEDFAFNYLSEDLAEFYSLYPNIKIDFKCAEDALQKFYELDVAILYQEPKQHDVVIILKKDIIFGLFASQGYLKEFGCPKNLEDVLLNHKICTGDNLIKLSSKWQEITQKAKNISATTNSLMILQQLTKNGLGISLQPLHIKNSQTDLIHIDNLNFQIKLPFWIVSNKASKDLPKVRALINHIISVTGNF